MKKCVFNTIFASNTLLMGLKFIYIYIYILLYCYAHCSSSSMSTLILQSLILIWAALMSSQRAKQLLSADWSYNIYIYLIHAKICKFFSVLVNEKEAECSWKKCDIGGRGFKKMSFCSNIFFDWSLILEINNFLNF